MAISDLLLNKASFPGLWFIMSKYTCLDISKLVFKHAVKGRMFLEIYTSDKERIISSVISMILEDELSNAIDPEEQYYVENEISEYYERGFFLRSELNDYLPNGDFWERQVWIYDYEPSFIQNCTFDTIILDDIIGLDEDYYKYNEASKIELLQTTERLAFKESKSVFVFVSDNTSVLTDNFIRERLI